MLSESKKKKGWRRKGKGVEGGRGGGRGEKGRRAEWKGSG